MSCKGYEMSLALKILRSLGVRDIKYGMVVRRIPRRGRISEVDYRTASLLSPCVRSRRSVLSAAMR